MMVGARVFPTLATEEHADAIAAFYRKVWSPAATAESVIASFRRSAANNIAAPGQPIPVAIVLVGADVVAYCGSIPQRLWNGTEETPAYWVKGLMVLPEFRNGPFGYLVVKELATHLECSTILVVALPARRLFSALGYKDLGAVRNWVRPLRARTMAQRLDLEALGIGALPRWVRNSAALARRSGLAGAAGGLAGLALSGAARLARLRASNVRVSTTDLPTAGELDELWASARRALAASPVRDSSYIVPRFFRDSPRSVSSDDSNPWNPYIFVTGRDGGRLVGFAAVRRPSAIPDPRLAGIHIATISEFLFPLGRSDAALATLGGIERASLGAGADAVTCMTSHQRLSPLLLQQGYFPLRGNVHFFLRDSRAGDRFPTDLSRWWLGRGDGESDTSF